MSMPLWNWKSPGPSSPSVSMVFQNRVRGSPKFARIGCCWPNGLIGHGYAAGLAGSKAAIDSTATSVRRTGTGTRVMRRRLVRRSALELVRLLGEGGEPRLQPVVGG